ncbi:class I SAM-dependent methyltransferase [Nocardiopsis sp. NPDC058631]|uniref:class I SAM-dependent methyltransferase n=1 Tax=Nocardiopsis sp. NPDC058631 TaxID=3346566 RepID=UPI00364B5420
MTEYTDPYAVSGEFLDIMIAGWWEHHGPAVAEAVRDLPADSGPVVDAGAGGGWGARLLARTLPGTRVLAIEPSPVLRAVLLSRIAASAELRDRVTVDGDDLLSARLPVRVGGVLAANLIGHFSPHERDALWGDLASRLAPNAFILTNLPHPVAPERVERTRMSDIRLGERTYSGWAQAEPDGPERVTWQMAYEVREGDRLVSRSEVRYPWWTVSESSLRAETEPHGLGVTPQGPEDAGLYRIGRVGR